MDNWTETGLHELWSKFLTGGYIGSIVEVPKEDTRSQDYSSHGVPGVSHVEA